MNRHAQSHHHSHAVAQDTGWSILRLSGLQRLGAAGFLVAVIWAMNLLVMG